MRWKNVRFIIFDTGEQAALAIPVELLLADFIARASTFISGKYKIANVPGTSGAAWEGGPPIYEPTTLDHWFWLINFCRRADTNSMAMEDEHCYLHVGPHIITIRISKHVWQWVYDRGRRASEWRIVNHDSHQVYYANYAGKYKAGGGVDLRGDGPLSYPTIAKQLNTIQDHEFSSALTAKIQSHEFSSALTTITVPPDIAAIAKDTQAETRAAKEVVDLMTGLNANQTKRMRDVLAGRAGAGDDAKQITVAAVAMLAAEGIRSLWAAPLALMLLDLAEEGEQYRTSQNTRLFTPDRFFWRRRERDNRFRAVTITTGGYFAPSGTKGAGIKSYTTATKISGALTPQSPTIDYTQDAYGHKLAVSREAGLLCAWLNYKFRDEMLFFVETLPSDADLADTEGQLFVLSDLQSQTCGERTKTGRQLTTKQKEIMQQNITALTTALHGRLNNFDNQLAAQQTLRSA